MNIYSELGVRRVINARGNLTLLGGSILSNEILDAMKEANACYVNMKELLDQAGKAVAQLTGAEAAFITPGAAAALVLSAAACMTGLDPEKVERLPNTEGMRSEILIQKGLRTKYDRCMTVPGATLVEVGGGLLELVSGVRPKQIEGAISDRTAAIHYLAPGTSKVVSIEDVVRIGKKHGVPIIVDAAGQVYPVENLKKYAAMGADLVCYGAKYFGGPSSTGIVVGRKDLVDAVALNSFIGFESSPYRALGRGYKVDRREVVAVVVALRRWMTMDHRSRFQSSDRKARYIVGELKKIHGIKLTPLPEEVGLATEVRIDLDKSPEATDKLVGRLREGDPSVWVGSEENILWINALTLVDGDEEVLVESLANVLSTT